MQDRRCYPILQKRKLKQEGDLGFELRSISPSGLCLLSCITLLTSSLSTCSFFQSSRIPQLPALVYYLGSKWQPRAPASLFFLIGIVDDEMGPLALAIGAEKIVLEYRHLNFYLYTCYKLIFPFFPFITTWNCFFWKGCVRNK